MPTVCHWCERTMLSCPECIQRRTEEDVTSESCRCDCISDDALPPGGESAIHRITITPAERERRSDAD